MINYKIKWSSSVKAKLLRNKKFKFKSNNIYTTNYRPFVKYKYYKCNDLSDRLTSNHYQLFGKNLDKKNIIIARVGLNTETPNSILASNILPDYSYLSPASNGCRIYALYKYDEYNSRKDNITDWGLEQFKNNYELQITKKDIFYYAYAVLHNPKYREKYKLNLKREFPRLPFYKNFYKWSNWGKTLMDLHINYETVKPYPAVKTLHATSPKENPKTKLKKDKKTTEIFLDENTSLIGIPEKAFEYKIGNRSAIEWILNQYKEKTYSKNVLEKYPDKKILNDKFNNYKFADYKEQIIDLIKRIATISIETIKIINQMRTETLF